MIDWSETRRWQDANARFHRLMRATIACERHLDAMRDLIRTDADKALWVHVTATRIDAWCEWLAEWGEAERSNRCEMRLIYEKGRR